MGINGTIGRARAVATIRRERSAEYVAARIDPADKAACRQFDADRLDRIKREAGRDAFSPEAQAYGRQTARKLLNGRKGHGGAPAARRVFYEAELAALCAIAFNAGQESGR